MADLFEARQLEVVALPEDLHYRVRDAATASELAAVRPVMVGEWRREEVSLLRRIRRMKPFAPLPELCKHHVPRMVFQVSDTQNKPLFLIDRADKVIGHPVVPDSVVATRGGVVGHLTTDHDKELEPYDGPVDSEGLTNIGGRSQLRDPNRRVLCDAVVRLDLSASPRRIEEYANVDMFRFVDGDGTVWARMIGSERALHCAPQTPHHLKMLFAAYMIVKEVNQRLHFDIDGASRIAPRSLDLEGEPYPGYSDVHAPYIRYQTEFVPRYAEHRKKVQGGAAAAASSGM
ncbi:hypothetical protein [Actinomadura rifamycini]|uniref:hypothetical protein n=1 Tax=Actinomadura rifamycini TaxID=31962 RepID=UPI00047E5D60|nr:hypothetical protein [Actinomadura rifamycini]